MVVPKAFRLLGEKSTEVATQGSSKSSNILSADKIFSASRRHSSNPAPVGELGNTPGRAVALLGTEIVSTRVA